MVPVLVFSKSIWMFLMDLISAGVELNIPIY